MDYAQDSKVVLSDADWMLAENSAFILTKNAIIQEVYALFGSLVEPFGRSAANLRSHWPEAFGASPKISKGEQYEGMPWAVLDYPRCFNRQKGHCAIRCFFWWGHFFSINLQLSGGYAGGMDAIIPQMQQEGWLAGFTSDPWNFNPSPKEWNPIPIAKKESESLYLKAMKALPIAQHGLAQAFFMENFRQLMLQIEDQLPMR
jgi:hypothetical protein